MADEEKAAPLGPRELAALLERLDLVMEEAQTLRREVTRQLAESRQRDQPRVTTNRRKRKMPKAAR